MIKTEEEWNGDKVIKLSNDAIDESVFKVGLVVEGQAKLLSPRDTGRLAGSITTQARTRGTETEGPTQAGDKINRPAVDKEALVGTAVDYAPYMEYGTIRTSAQPFLRPALDMAQGKVITITREEMKRELGGYLQ